MTTLTIIISIIAALLTTVMILGYMLHRALGEVAKLKEPAFDFPIQDKRIESIKLTYSMHIGKGQLSMKDEMIPHIMANIGKSDLELFSNCFDVIDRGDEYRLDFSINILPPKHETINPIKA